MGLSAFHTCVQLGYATTDGLISEAAITTAVKRHFAEEFNAGFL
jgi:hypothetical protein